MKKDKSNNKFYVFYQLVLICFLWIMSMQVFSQVLISTKPSWVNTIHLENQEITDETGGYQYHLIDDQVNIPKQTYYSRKVYQLLTPSGVQSLSTVSVNFDPSYQKLKLHKLEIIRGNQSINKLSYDAIESYQRESSMERNLYDGSTTTVINLTDVRVGDIIDFSYSLVGFNPVNKGHFSDIFMLQYQVPVNTIALRVMATKGKPIFYKLFNQLNGPEISETGNIREYAWKVKGLDYIIYEPNTPIWYDPSKFVQFTTFITWEKVIKWGLPLYELDDNDLESVEISLSNPAASREEQIIETIRWVQDEVRYLSLSSGMSAYEPHKPEWVLNNRYGDCKDKSLLLVALLKKMGLQAYPVLVNPYTSHTMKEYLPAFNNFTHCVVCLKYYQKSIFIDPTINYQGGNLENISFPDYEYGLIIKEGTTRLSRIPTGKLPKLEVKQRLDFDSLGGSIQLNIISTYTHALADEQRAYFKANALQNIQQDFSDYYSYAYPGIEPMGKIIINDDFRNTSNIFTTEENYLINNGWQDLGDSSTVYFEFYPLIIKSSLPQTQSSLRSMPYYVGRKGKVSELATFIMPEDWSVVPEYNKIEGDGFRFNEVISSKENMINYELEYETTEPYILAESTESFFKKHNQIEDKLAFQISYNPAAENFKLSWAGLSITLLFLAIAIFLSIMVYRKFDPISDNPDENRKIGGWLVLPLIGIVIGPFLTAYYFFSSDFFNHNSWLGTFAEYGSASGMLMSYYFIQLFLYTFFIVYSVLVLILFIQRRSSLPFLYIVMLVLNLFWGIYEYVKFEELSEYLVYEEGEVGLDKNLARTFFALVIWAPYFTVSKRVKTTFTRRYGSAPNETTFTKRYNSTPNETSSTDNDEWGTTTLD